MNNRLRRFAGQRIFSITIKTIFYDIKIQCAHLVDTEAVDGMINDMEFEFVVSLTHAFNQFVEQQ